MEKYYKITCTPSIEGIDNVFYEYTDEELSLSLCLDRDKKLYAYSIVDYLFYSLSPSMKRRLVDFLFIHTISYKMEEITEKEFYKIFNP